MIDNEGVRPGAQIEQPVPIGLGAGEAGGLQGEHRAALPQADGGHQPVEVTSALGGSAALAEVLIQEHDWAAIPAQVHRSVGQGVLPLGTFAMAVHLAWGRLAAVDLGLALEMVGTELG
jgi:hypothetical protein